MSENQILLVFCLAAVVPRIPRIIERWKAPLLRGPEWFFSIRVTADFLKGTGAAILRKYRWRLFLPWAIELPICAAILIARVSRVPYIMLLVVVITLFTRLNYYLARQWAEDQARRIAGPAASEPPVAVALSLQTRTLRDYTNPGIEATIILAFCGSAAWLAFRCATEPDWHALTMPLRVVLISIYIQAGVLLAKRAFVRARVVAPLENPEQYLAWRDSLRRLSTTICDYLRVMIALCPLLALTVSVVHPWQGSTAQVAAAAVIIAFGLVATWYEWKQRLQHLRVARETKPANFLLRPDVPDNPGLICFRPSLPVLLLNSPNGYALNLASAAVKVAGLYVAGYAALWILLTRFGV